MKIKPFDFAGYHGRPDAPPKVERDEFRAYRAHLANHPELTNGLDRGRPSVQIAGRVWELVVPYMAASTPGRLLARARWDASIETTVRQALVVTLDLFRAHAQVRKPVSLARLLRELASRWSPRYRAIRTSTGCTEVQKMPLDDVRAIIRELRCVGLDFALFYKVGAGQPKYMLTPVPLYLVGKNIPRRGYPLVQRRKVTELMAAFEAAVAADPEYRRPRARPVSGLHLASQPMPAASPKRQYAGAVAFNVVENGERALARIRELESTVLLFDVVNFKSDYVTYRRMLREALRVEPTSTERRKIQGRVDAVRNVRRQVQALKPDELLDGRYVEIRVGYRRSINRRYNARTFGPEWVSGHAMKGFVESQRERWFRFERPSHWVQPPAPVLTDAQRAELARFNIDPAEWLEGHTVTFNDQLVASTPLRGYDTSSSMTQILTWFCGITELEPLVFNPEKSFTTYLGELFWSHRAALGLRAEFTRDDVKDMAKKVWTAHIYGALLRNAVVSDLRWISDPTAMPPARPGRGASLIVQQAYKKLRREWHREHVVPVVDAITNLLSAQSWYGELQTYFKAMKHAARAAYARDPFAGVKLLDPYDCAVVRWNPVAVDKTRLSGDEWSLILRTPRGLRDAVTGDYQVDDQKLRREMPPFVVHMLDASLSALVMEQFARARLPLVTMHDAWYTAGHREVPPVLGEFGVETPIKIAVQAAAREWDRRLEGVYVTLVDYLTGTPFEGWAREIQARWWAKTSSPRFVLSPTPKPA